MLIIGASVRSMMQSAAWAGFEAEGLDFFGDLDANRAGRTRGLANDLNLPPTTAGLLRVARKMGPGEELLYLSGPENNPGQLAFWEKQGRLRGNGTAALEKVRDPFWLGAALREIGEAMPETLRPGAAAETLEGEYLLKPRRRGGGHGIQRLEAGHPWRAGLRIHSDKNLDSDYILQTYHDWDSGSFTFLADGQKTQLVGTSGQWPVTGRFLYCGNLAPLPGLSPALEARFGHIAVHLVHKAGLVGLNTVDFLLCGEKLLVLEVNPRWSASVELLEALAGRPIFGHHLAACRGALRPFEAGGQHSGFAAKAIVYSGHPLTVGYPDEDAPEALVQRGIRDLPRPGTEIKTGQPLCTVLAQGETEQGCRAALARQEQWVRAYYTEHALQ